MNDVLSRHHNFGVLEGPVLLFGGPYSNFEATTALFERASLLGITGMRSVCTGDVCAYCGNPSETARLVMGSGAHVVAGNCELSLGTRAPDCGCGFEDGAACDRFAMEWFRFADAEIDEGARAWMNALPGIGSFVAYGKRYAVIHGGASAVNRFLWPVVSDDVLREEIELIQGAIGTVDGVVAGHTGMAFDRRVVVGKRSVQWINAGAIGLPAHNGDPRTQFALLTRNGLRFERLDYDYATAAAVMRDAGLQAGYDRSLETGYWPSEDSFPEEMRLGRVA